MPWQNFGAGLFETRSFQQKEDVFNEKKESGQSSPLILQRSNRKQDRAMSLCSVAEQTYQPSFLSLPYKGTAFRAGDF